MKIKMAISFFISVVLLGCAHKYKYSAHPNDTGECRELDDGLSGVALDSSYAYTLQNAVRVGGDGSENELKYLQMLLGPRKEFLDGFVKAGNFWGNNLTLSGYKVILKGDTLPRMLYIDTHHCRDPKAPIGFSVRDETREIKNISDEGKSFDVPKKMRPE